MGNGLGRKSKLGAIVVDRWTELRQEEDRSKQKRRKGGRGHMKYGFSDRQRFGGMVDPQVQESRELPISTTGNHKRVRRTGCVRGAFEG